MKTKKVSLTWTGPQKYLGGRTLRKGDEVTLTRRDARLYKALGVATDTPAQIAPVVERHDPEPAAESIDALRARYEVATGAPPDRRWGIARLRAALTGGPRYQRRDMQAEE